MRTTPEQRADFEDQIRSVIPRWLKEAYALDIAPDLLADLKDLERERENDWTASLCDRLNSFLREHPKAGNECKDGPTACDLVDALHGYAGSLVAENARLREACKSLLERFSDMYDGAPDSRCGWMVPFIDELRKALK